MNVRVSVEEGGSKGGEEKRARLFVTTAWEGARYCALRACCLPPATPIDQGKSGDGDGELAHSHLSVFGTAPEAMVGYADLAAVAKPPVAVMFEAHPLDKMPPEALREARMMRDTNLSPRRRRAWEIDVWREQDVVRIRKLNEQCMSLRDHSGGGGGGGGSGNRFQDAANAVMSANGMSDAAVSRRKERDANAERRRWR